MHYLFLIGICVEAITGAMAAGRKKMDFFGVILIAAITALGGGTVRDLLFNTYPLTWVAHPEYLLYTTSSAIFAIAVAPYLNPLRRLFLILDAVGLATFVILGTQKILSEGLSPSVAILAGMITGICGGMIRDILCNDIPLVLRNELYAVIALIGALVFIVCSTFHIPNSMSIPLTFFVIFLMRLWAIFFHIEIPKFDYSDLNQ